MLPLNLSIDIGHKQELWSCQGERGRKGRKRRAVELHQCLNRMTVKSLLKMVEWSQAALSDGPFCVRQGLTCACSIWD